jgi:hypothetical protein
MSHCRSPFIGLEIQTPTTPTNDVKPAGRDTFSVIPSKILESSRRSQDTTEMLVQNHELKAYTENHLDQVTITRPHNARGFEKMFEILCTD